MFGWLRKSWDWMKRRSERVARRDAIASRQEAIKRGEWAFFGNAKETFFSRIFSTKESINKAIVKGNKDKEITDRKNEAENRLKDLTTKKAAAETKRTAAITNKDKAVTAMKDAILTRDNPDSPMWQKLKARWTISTQSANIKKENAIAIKQGDLINKYEYDKLLISKSEEQHKALLTEIRKGSSEVRDGKGLRAIEDRIGKDKNQLDEELAKGAKEIEALRQNLKSIENRQKKEKFTQDFLEVEVLDVGNNADTYKDKGLLAQFTENSRKAKGDGKSATKPPKKVGQFTADDYRNPSNDRNPLVLTKTVLFVGTAKDKDGHDVGGVDHFSSSVAKITNVKEYEPVLAKYRI